MKFGVTQNFECAYLPEESERLLVLIEEQFTPEQSYELLLSAGFRRSGEQIYRPHCEHCQACQSLRLMVEKFKPSRSQKRIWAHNQDITVTISHSNKPEYYTLYENYITERHADGSMFPPSEEQYLSFLCQLRAKQLFFEFHLEQKLVAVAVTDEVSDALSALYTFFDPTLSSRSLGTFAILTQIQHAKTSNKEFMYLGYQIDACDKMNYKSKFYPHQRFLNNKWQEFTKKTA
ncbi:arginyltransferase [Alteromonadaceae bacterium BrNp21-10]|nr:arginyltransferase [Alteromonadaceae bacterium BrNp21-10]